ncbi:MAG: hypothetical protein K2Q20_05830 [Phycisphaerales bacterium]|nr:hypothetical protein [Phycisphaerales bacterium]
MDTREREPTSPYVPDAEISDAGAGNGPESFRLADRRTAPRVRMVLPGKIFRRLTQQYVPAQSRDVSGPMIGGGEGGALLEVETKRGLQVGEILDIALAMSPGAVVSSSAMLSAVVVRSSAIDQTRQRVAIRYLGRAAMAKAA